MATVDAATEGTAHGTLTANTAEVITFAAAGAHRGQVSVQNRGTTVMYGEYGVDDLDVAGQGTEAVAPGETVVFAGDTATVGKICLKSTGTPAYSISRFMLPREATVGGGTGGSITGEVALDAASLAALESVGTSTVTAVTLANVAGSASSVALFASNAAARGRVIHNDSTAALYVKFGATASTTSYTVRLDADAYYEFPPPLYTGVVDGIWASATGSARTTEVS
jgi:hypothetical protein